MNKHILFIEANKLIRQRERDRNSPDLIDTDRQRYMAGVVAGCREMFALFKNHIEHYTDEKWLLAHRNKSVKKLAIK